MSAARRGRPVKAAAANDESEGVLYARVPNTLLADLDAWAAKLNAGKLGPQWTRNDIVRVVLARAVKERGSKGGEP